MDVELVEDTKSRMVIDLPGRGHTLCNTLKSELWEDKNVKVASYNIAHPLVGIPRMVIETSGESPRDAVKIAVNALSKQADEVISAAKKI